MSEVLDGMGLLESHMTEIAAKVDRIDEMAGHLEEMPVRELMSSVEALEDKATTSGGFEHRNSSTGSVARMEERIEGLDDAQQAIVKMVSNLSEDLRATLVVVRAEVADLSAKLNLTMRAVGYQTPAWGVVQFNKINVLKPKLFCGFEITRL